MWGCWVRGILLKILRKSYTVVDSRAARLDWELTKDAFTDEGFAYWTENYPAVDFESEDVVGLEK